MLSQEQPLCVSSTGDLPERERLRVLCVIPGEEGDSHSMPYARRQVEGLRNHGIDARPHFHSNRRKVSGILHEIRRVRQVVREWGPAVVHSHFGGLTGATCALASTVPLVITYRGSDLNPAPGDSPVLSRVRIILSHFAARSARQLICVSEQLRCRLGTRGQGAFVIPTGVRMDLFQPVPNAEARRRLGWQDDPVALISVRDDPAGKRLDLAEAALAWVQERMPAAKLVVLRGNRVPPAEMPVYYSAADCLLMMSDFEGSPNVVKESLACNLPVVAVDVGDVRERLAGVEHSTVVPRDPAAIGAALLPILATRPRSNGRACIQMLDEEVIARRIADVYREAAGVSRVVRIGNGVRRAA